MNNISATAELLVLRLGVSVVAVVTQSGWGSTENAGPENGGPKNDERTENAGLKMKDQMSGVDNAGPKHQDRKMEDQQPEADYEI